MGGVRLFFQQCLYWFHDLILVQGISKISKIVFYGVGARKHCTTEPYNHGQRWQNDIVTQCFLTRYIKGFVTPSSPQDCNPCNNRCGHSRASVWCPHWLPPDSQHLLLDTLCGALVWCPHWLPTDNPGTNYSKNLQLWYNTDVLTVKC